MDKSQEIIDALKEAFPNADFDDINLTLSFVVDDGGVATVGGRLRQLYRIEIYYRVSDDFEKIRPDGLIDVVHLVFRTINKKTSLMPFRGIPMRGVKVGDVKMDGHVAIVADSRPII